MRMQKFFVGSLLVGILTCMCLKDTLVDGKQVTVNQNEENEIVDLMFISPFEY